MTTFTVHEPPPRKNEETASPVRFAFVRDGFYFWALGVSGLVKFTVGLLIATLVGFEAGSLRRWSLRRWTNRGIVVAYNREAAEHRFFDRWSGSLAPTEPPAPPPGARVPTSDQDIIGLFPEPQTRP